MYACVSPYVAVQTKHPDTRETHNCATISVTPGKLGGFQRDLYRRQAINTHKRRTIDCTCGSALCCAARKVSFTRARTPSLRKGCHQGRTTQTKIGSECILTEQQRISGNGPLCKHIVLYILLHLSIIRVMNSLISAVIINQLNSSMPIFGGQLKAQFCRVMIEHHTS